MKTKLMTFAMMMAVMSTISCSKDLYDENKANELKQAEEAAKQAKFIAQYKANFEKRYGQVDPNQSWDFTYYTNASQARTRGDESYSYIVDAQVQEGYNFFVPIVNQDFNVIKGLLDKNSVEIKVNGNKVKGVASIKTWGHFFSAKLTPMYAHSNLPVGTNRYYHIGFNGTDDNAAPQEMIANIKVKGFGYNYWYDARASLIHHTSRDINTISATNSSYWCNYSCDANDKNPFYGTHSINTNDDFQYAEIADFREILIYVNNKLVRTYWGFDCDGDGDYSDVICLVRDYKDPEPIVKRYLIEDLGDADDFDFNDIVVDVVDNRKGEKTAIIRAMGGTIDFTLNIGGTTWTKSIDGANLDPVVNVKDMVNTEAGEIDYNAEIATFSVPNWNPGLNNITITVNGTMFDTIYTIQFPHVGEVPMIVAVSPEIQWMTERVGVPAEWWQPITATPEE